MIAMLTGAPSSMLNNSILMEVGGVGYEVFTTRKVAEDILTLPVPVQVHIHHSIKENEQSLYGFLEIRDKQVFLLMVDKVPNIGPKTALGILNAISSADLQALIAAKDQISLSKIKGVGKKTAERLVIELHETMAILGGIGASGKARGSNYQDATLALIRLGYKPADIPPVLDRVYDPAHKTADLVSLFLKELK